MIFIMDNSKRICSIQTCKGCSTDFYYIRKHLAQKKDCKSSYSKTELIKLKEISERETRNYKNFKCRKNYDSKKRADKYRGTYNREKRAMQYKRFAKMKKKRKIIHVHFKNSIQKVN